jgi:hypothetical protein
MTETSRYALYLAPEADTRLWEIGSALLGYDARSGQDIPFPAVSGFDAETLRTATADPRRYGFHLTLKAPFRLAEGHAEADLMATAETFAAERPEFDVGPLQIETRMLGPGSGFICLVPRQPCPALAALEENAVRAFDPFRQPLTAEDLARRKPERLTPRQRALLDAWGYPFVLDEYRPHFSLTGAIAAPERLADALSLVLAMSIGTAHLRVSSLMLFVQPAPSDRFRIAAKFPLKGAGSTR